MKTDEWAVSVLDGWSKRTGGFWSNGFRGDRFCCFLHFADGGKYPHHGSSAEESRIDAATYIAGYNPDFLGIESKQRAVCNLAQRAIYLISYLKTQPFDCNGLDEDLDKAIKDWEVCR